MFRRYGGAWRAANEGHLSLGQRRVMTAIEICRTAALGGHVERCDDCSHTRIAYNSCRNRHCPKCQWRAAEAWLAAREAELLPVPYFHVVFTLPAAIGAIAYQNKAKVYGLLFTAAAEALTTIAADPKHLGADIGVTAVLHTWGQNLDHHPHVHCIVPGGGISPDGDGWVSSRRNFFLSVRVLSRLFRRLFLEGLVRLHEAGELQFFNDLAPLDGYCQSSGLDWRRCVATDWVVYAKRPFAGPSQVLAYLARYTHRVAIGNSRLVSIDDGHVAFRWKDYRDARSRQIKVMRLTAGEFMRRFLLHVLPDGFHRIRHYGLFANGHRAEKLALCRKLLNVPARALEPEDDEPPAAGDDRRHRRRAPAAAAACASWRCSSAGLRHARSARHEVRYFMMSMQRTIRKADPRRASITDRRRLPCAPTPATFDRQRAVNLGRACAPQSRCGRPRCHASCRHYRRLAIPVASAVTIPIGQRSRPAVSCNRVSATPPERLERAAMSTHGIAETSFLCDTCGLALLSHLIAIPYCNTLPN